MKRMAALFKGMNVGGHNKVKMADLRAHFEAAGFADIKTYVQSGNVVFSGGASLGKTSAAIAKGFGDRFGFSPVFLLLDAADLQRAIAENPFPDAAGDPAKLHVGFLFEQPKADAVTALEARDTLGDRWRIVGDRFYLHTPDCLGTSKFADKGIRALQVEMTMRNWRSLMAIAALL